ncbi:MAG: serine/threonine-protein kinase [Persicimonas sp.]
MIPHNPTEHVDNMPGVGDLIGGRYRLESVIGRGALGTVMRAQHITMGRDVAVKLLRPDISSHTTIRHRLIQRVHQAQQLSHPNNCRLFDFGQSAGSLYIVMELLQGATLDTIIDRGAPYPVGWVVDIGLQILDGLGEAHDENFVHRNLKPSNIFLLPRRRGGQQVKLLDYGLASSLDSLPGDDDDREAEICGTAAYLSPETLVKQQSGKASDVYAVGLILIEMLTGRQVFTGDSLAQILYKQIHTSVRLPAKLAWTSLGKVLLKSVSKHPDNRFRDADAFYEALENASQSTASYFRLDSQDLEPEDEPMPPELLARMMRNQRSRRDSDRDDDEDSDESEPQAVGRLVESHPPIEYSPSDASGEVPGDSEWSFPLTPPPLPVPGSANGFARKRQLGRGLAEYSSSLDDANTDVSSAEDSSANPAFPRPSSRRAAGERKDDGDLSFATRASFGSGGLRNDSDAAETGVGSRRLLSFLSQVGFTAQRVPPRLVFLLAALFVSAAAMSVFMMLSG